MKRLFSLALLALLAAPPLRPQPPAVFGQLAEILANLSEVTGLEAPKQLDTSLIRRDQLKKFLEQRIRKEIRPEEVRSEEILLKKFGLVPPDFDLKKTFVELYTEQAAAFYDFRKKKLFLLESGDEGLQQVALTHELAHALADRHFRLERYLDRAANNDDAAMARMAVMEGQATWLMSELALRRLGQSLQDAPYMVEVMSRMMGLSAGRFPVLDNAPLYIRESLMFPYSSGVKFQQAVVEKLGRKAFGEVFRNPPRSTQEILHPEKYFNRHETAAPELPRLANERPYKELATGTLGEFDFAVLLRQYAGEESARTVAPQWRGGAYRLLEHKKDRRTVLIHASRWATEEATRRFFRDYRKTLESKWKAIEITEDTGARLAGRGDDGFFLLRASRRDVYVIEGMKTPADVAQAALAQASACVLP